MKFEFKNEKELAKYCGNTLCDKCSYNSFCPHHQYYQQGDDVPLKAQDIEECFSAIQRHLRKKKLEKLLDK